MKNWYAKQNLTNSLVTAILFCSLLLSILPGNGSTNAVSAQTDLNEIRVGIFNAGTLAADSDIALENMFEWMGATVLWVNGPSIRGGILSTLDIVAFPGGSMRSYSFNLTQVGQEAIRQFVANGGSYFGICGGALFATDYLGFVEGTWSTDIPGRTSSISLIQMTVHQDETGPNLSNEPETYQTLYWSSSFFIPTNPTDIIPIMSYSENAEPGMFVTRYGSGTVFCSSPHPEYEEGDFRDGTTQFDYLEDPDSEWGFLQKATQWLIEESPAASPNLLETFGGIIIFGLLAIIVVLIGVTFFYRRHQTVT